MMTRETKAGLVVSCSFLCLVGIVLVSKLRETNRPGGTAENSSASVSAPAEPQPVKESGSGSPLLANVVDSTLSKNDKHQPESKITPAAFKAEENASALPAAKTAASQPLQKAEPPLASKNVASSAVQQKENTSAALEDTSPIPDGDKEKANAGNPAPAAAPAVMIAQPTIKSQKSTILNWVPDSEKKKATSLQGMGLRPAAGADTTRLASQTQTDIGGRTETTPPSAAGNTKSPIDGLPLPQIGTKQDARPDVADNAKLRIKGIAIAPAPSPTPTIGAAAAADPLADLGAGATARNLLDQTASPSALAPHGNGKDGKSSTDASPPAGAAGQGNGIRSGLVGIIPSSNSNNSGLEQGVHLNPPVIAPPKQMASGASSPANAPAFNDDSSSRSPAPLGAPIPAVQPIVAPSLPVSTPATGTPQVESYDEDTYTCKANDSFRTISQAVYRTDAYDQALLLFNRNHPLANEAIKQNPPLLQAGQPIYIPPLQILRKYYAASIPDTNSAPAPGSTLSSETPRAGQPIATSTEAPRGIQPIALAPSASGSAAPALSSRTYRVAGNGEMIRDIARRTLGNGDRWTEIYQLNRGYDPMYAVPAGTELRLPADARVDAQ